MDSAGLGLAQIGQHTQEKKTLAAARLLSAGYHCYDGNRKMEALWISPVFPALVQAVIAECTELAPINAENGAFVSGVAAKRVAGQPTEGGGRQTSNYV